MDDTLTKIFGVVFKAAPVLASVLASPLAGVGISLLASTFGVSASDTRNLLTAIQGDPDAQIKLATLEMQHQDAFNNYQANIFQSEVDDSKSARQMEMATNSRMPFVISLIFICIYSIVQFYCVEHGNAATDIISARFQDALIMIFGFYFGRSHAQATSSK